ncbi:hypothetical protein [Sphingomonas morindae]|uniref:YD repeat-containing protein n=1 Tax=Sphingomonas morindae TaxID=1541170 RepID=A0ABY4X7S2_9SPHN|nr:hypothetical protein [Sphingomonas morindae]USI72962.1 hypothetical protein LHA26_00315 [Sphingomonas morindae]
MSNATIISSAQLSNGNIVDVTRYSTYLPYYSDPFYETTYSLISANGKVLVDNQDLSQSPYTDSPASVVASKTGGFVLTYNNGEFEAVFLDASGVRKNSVSFWDDFSPGGSAKLNGDDSITVSYSGGSDSYGGEDYGATTFRPDGSMESQTGPTYGGSWAIHYTTFYDKNGKALSTELESSAIREDMTTLANGWKDARFYDGNGHLVATARYDASGKKLQYDSIDGQGHHYTTTWNPDGSYQYRYDNGLQHVVNSYDAADELTAQDISVPLGDHTHKTFDPGSGILLKTETHHADGSKTVDQLVSGQVYARQITDTGADNKITALERFFANGSKEFSEHYYADGSFDAVTYDALGHVVSSVTGAADHSRTAVSNTYARNSDFLMSVLQERYGADGTVLERTSLNSDGTSRLTAYQPSLLTAPSGTSTIMVGSPLGSDTFAFGQHFGAAAISGFVAGNGTGHDQLSLSGWAITDFHGLQAHMTSVSDGTLIALSDHDTILLRGVSPAALTASDFLFY